MSTEAPFPGMVRCTDCNGWHTPEFHDETAEDRLQRHLIRLGNLLGQLTEVDIPDWLDTDPAPGDARDLANELTGYWRQMADEGVRKVWDHALSQPTWRW